GVVVTPNGQYAYIANYAGFVSVVETSYNTLVTNIADAAGGAPTKIAVTPDRQYVYTTIYDSYTGGKFNIIQTSNNTVVDTVSVAYPNDIAISTFHSKKEDIFLRFEIKGVDTGQTHNGITTNVASTPTELPFKNILS